MKCRLQNYAQASIFPNYSFSIILFSIRLPSSPCGNKSHRTEATQDQRGGFGNPAGGGVVSARRSRGGMRLGVALRWGEPASARWGSHQYLSPTAGTASIQHITLAG